MTDLFWKIVSVVELACWPLCFWWMHRISSRQNAVLSELKQQAQRIEKVSTEEHRILAELHPTVEKMEKDLDEVAESTRQ